KGVFGAGELSELGREFQRARMAGRPGAPTWAVVHTEPPAALAGQLKVFPGAGAAKVSVAPEQFRLQAYQAILGGARGLVFKLRSRLDGQNSESELRAAALKW